MGLVCCPLPCHIFPHMRHRSACQKCVRPRNLPPSSSQILYKGPHVLIPLQGHQIIDVVPDEVIWTVNCWQYLNYEPIDCTSSTPHLFRTMNNLGHTFLSYGWCNGIPHAVPLFKFFSERFASDRLSHQRWESFPRVGLIFISFEERLRVWPSFLWTGFYVPSPSYILRYCFGICVSVSTYVRQ